MNIVDIIDHQGKYGVQRMVVLDRFPQFVYERQGRYLIGFDEIAMRFFKYEAPTQWASAFGGDKFDLQMADGTVEHAWGQWWDTPAHEDFRDMLCAVGVSTIERLSTAYCFSGGIHLSQFAVDEWLKSNEPSNNYHKYESRHKDFGKHRIVSMWEKSEAQA